MAYTRPTYNADNITWLGESTYTRPAYNAADVSWVITDQAVQGQITLTGYTPSLQLQPPFQAFQGEIGISGYVPVFHNGFRLPAQQGQIAVTGYQPEFSTYAINRAHQGSVDFAGYAPSLALFKANQGSIAFSGYEPRFIAGFIEQPTIGQITFEGYIGQAITRSDTDITPRWISTYYVCTLTGAADGMDDLTIPIKSFQTRYGSDPYRIYLSVVVPGIDAYIDDINARPNGSLIIDRIYNYLDGSSANFRMAKSVIDTITTNQGDKSGVTGTLSGYLQSTAENPLNITLTDPITRSSDNGRRRYRCQIDPRVRPLDTVTINGESFQVDQVIHIIDTKTAIMEVQELVA